MVLVAALGTAVAGHFQGMLLEKQQPMKMAAAEAQYETKQPASFSLFTIGSLDGSEEVFSIRIPHLLSFLATGDWNGEVEGVNDLREEYIQEYGQDPGAAYYSPGDYTPYIPVTYWSFRLMIGLGMLAMAIGVVLLWIVRKGRAPTHRVWAWTAVALPLLPVAGNSFGWIFTEMGRQPWVVFGLMTTQNGVSPGVSTTEAWISISSLIAVYAVLIVVEVGLMLRAIRAGADAFEEPPDPKFGDDHDPDRPLAFAY
jgi:cytochrome d ubiquinol oxidase subunit I